MSTHLISAYSSHSISKKYENTFRSSKKLVYKIVFSADIFQIIDGDSILMRN